MAGEALQGRQTFCQFCDSNVGVQVHPDPEKAAFPEDHMDRYQVVTHPDKDGSKSCIGSGSTPEFIEHAA